MVNRYRVLAIGDPHFRVSTIKEAREFTEKIVAFIKEHKPNMVVILGDLANDFERIHVLVLREITRLFNEIRKAIGDHGHLVYVVGNHDYLNNQCFLTDEHAFTPFKRLIRADVEIIDYPRSIGGFLFVPYVAPGRFEEALRKCPQPGRVSAIFCHQEFNGVQVGPHQSVKGDRWPQDWPLVISGHIHERQWLQANLLYVGSPYQINFGEEDDKSVTLLDFVEGKSFPEHRFFNLGMPLRITKTLSIEEAREYIAPENAKVRIYLTGTTEELSAFKKSKKYKEMEKLFRIIPKPTDKISVQRNTAGRNFMELLTESLASESRAVQDTFAEIMDAHKA